MGILSAPADLGHGIVDPIAAKVANPFSTSVGRVYDGPDFPEGLRFVEIINGKEHLADMVILMGNMLPKNSFDFGGEQRITRDYYPGNPEPTAQVLGPKEGDVTVTGSLKSKRFKDKSLIKAVEEVQKQIDDVRRRGNLLRIWLGEWQRYGFLEKAEFKMKRLSEIEYTLTFAIIGFQLPKNNKFASTNRVSPDDLNQELLNKVIIFEATYSNIPSSVPRSIAEVLSGIISDVSQSVKLVTGFVDTVISTAEDLDKVAHRALGLIKNARATISKTRRRIGALRFDLNNIQGEYKAAKKFASAYNNQKHIMDSMVALSTLSAVLAAMQKRFEALAKQIPIARYRVKAGDTLQAVSVHYYNTAENWEKLYTHNKLTSTQLVVGSVLEIPRV
jgi:LysM repeat protein